MYDKPLDERRRALEEAFFNRENERILHALREKKDRETHRRALAQACGVQDESVLDAVLDVGIDAETLAALAVVPLVSVAWANGSCTDDEREAVRRAAAEVGIDEGSHAAELLAGWLQVRPGSRLFAAWEGCATALADSLDPGQRGALREDFARRARAVAEAAGGFLGIGSISDAEEAVIGRIRSAL